MGVPGAEPEGGLAILAGRGALPRLIAEHRRAVGQPYLVISFPGAAEPWMAGHPHQAHEFEKAGGLFAALRRAGCSEVVFAGAMNRPRLRPWRADAKSAALMGRAIGLLARGDDGLLAGLSTIFEAEGFRVVGAQDFLAGLTAEPGTLGRHRPDVRDRADVARAAAILATLGSMDVGQGVVVAGGLCLGVEPLEGTDALLARVAGLREHAPEGGVLVKLARPGQDRRFDLPAIGPRTVDGAAQAGLNGIAIEAGGSVLIDRVGTVEAADAAGLFLWSVTHAELTG